MLGLPHRALVLTVTLLQIVLAVTILISFDSDTLAKTYYDNTSITSKLNVSNKAPVVYDVIIFDNNSQTNLLLEQGTVHTVICNATVNDTNGISDIEIVNATIYKTPEFGPSNAVDNNYRYVNSSCTQFATSGRVTAYYTCHFHVWYYAFNGTWRCNVTAIDNSSAINRSYDDAIIDPLFALNLSATEIDFGELEPGEESPADEKVNITNFGNMNISVAVKGYGRTEGDDQAMNCTVGNISIGYERYSIQAAQAWSAMAALTSNWTNITGLVVPFRLDDNDNNNKNSTNTTYWKIKAPFGTKGVCNGTIVFSAVNSP